MYNTPTNLFFPAAFGNRTIKGFPLYNSGKKNADFCMVAFAQCSSRRCGLREYFSDYSLSKKLCCLQCAVAIFLQHLHKKVDWSGTTPPLWLCLLAAILAWASWAIESRKQEDWRLEEPRKLLVMPQTPFNADKSAKSFSIFDYALENLLLPCLKNQQWNIALYFFWVSNIIHLTI